MHSEIPSVRAVGIDQGFNNIQAQAPLTSLLPYALKVDHRLYNGLPQIKSCVLYCLPFGMTEPLARIKALGFNFGAHTVRIILLGELQTWMVLLCYVLC